MKKVLICIVCVSVAAVLCIMLFANKNDAENISITVNNQEIVYSASHLRFYNSIKDEYDAAAGIMDTKTNAAAADQDSEIIIKTAHKPFRLYQLNPNGENERETIPYHKSEKCYKLPLYDAEECSYKIVADCGIHKYVYSFYVFNKTYIESRNNTVPGSSVQTSAYQSLDSTSDVTLTAEDLCSVISYAHFGFKITNNTSEPIECLMFKLEKQIGGKWYNVEERDVSYNRQFWDEYKSRFPLRIGAKGSVYHEFPASPDALFAADAGNGLRSGVYRVILPYTKNGEKYTAISNPFNIGYTRGELRTG